MQFQAISEPSASVLIKTMSDIGKVWVLPGFLHAGGAHLGSKMV
jgi:hypothetical protein